MGCGIIANLCLTSTSYMISGRYFLHLMYNVVRHGSGLDRHRSETHRNGKRKQGETVIETIKKFQMCAQTLSVRHRFSIVPFSRVHLSLFIQSFNLDTLTNIRASYHPLGSRGSDVGTKERKMWFTCFTFSQHIPFDQILVHNKIPIQEMLHGRTL